MWGGLGPLSGSENDLVEKNDNKGLGKGGEHAQKVKSSGPPNGQPSKWQHMLRLLEMGHESRGCKQRVCKAD
jgi:hypothetical protein